MCCLPLYDTVHYRHILCTQNVFRKLALTFHNEYQFAKITVGPQAYTGLQRSNGCNPSTSYLLHWPFRVRGQTSFSAVAIASCFP